LKPVDIYSRFAWTYPLKSKIPTEILPYIKVVISNIKSKYPTNIITVTPDLGSEFKGIVKQYLKMKVLGNTIMILILYLQKLIWL
jgi:hypothetical protein